VFKELEETDPVGSNEIAERVILKGPTVETTVLWSSGETRVIQKKLGSSTVHQGRDDPESKEMFAEPVREPRRDTAFAPIARISPAALGPPRRVIGAAARSPVLGGVELLMRATSNIKPEPQARVGAALDG